MILGLGVSPMRRREFITLLGGGAAAWPLAARGAQQGERVRRIGVLMSAVEGDQRGLESITAFAQGLSELGWTVGRNVRIEYRWGAGDLDRFRRYAAELIALSPDVVLATAGSKGRTSSSSTVLPRVERTRFRRSLPSWLDCGWISSWRKARWESRRQKQSPKPSQSSWRRAPIRLELAWSRTSTGPAGT